MIDRTDDQAVTERSEPASPERRSDCPPWCTDHAGDKPTSVHFGEIHAVEVTDDEEPVKLQLVAVTQPADLAEAPAVYLSLHNSDGVNLEPREARYVASLLTGLADEIERASRGRGPTCPPWCTRHDDESNIHFGVVSRVKLAQEPSAVTVQLEKVEPDGEDPGQPLLIHLQQAAGHDGVSVLPTEARSLAAMLTDLALQAEEDLARPLHPDWCEDHDNGGAGPSHDHRGRSYQYDGGACTFRAAVEAWDDNDELSSLHVALSMKNHESHDQGYGLRITVPEARGLMGLLGRVLQEASWAQREAWRPARGGQR